jgi:hypothetical protein
MLQTIDYFEISCLGAPFSRLEEARNHMGRGLVFMVDVLMGFHQSTFSKPNTKFNAVSMHALLLSYMVLWQFMLKILKPVQGIWLISEKNVQA